MNGLCPQCGAPIESGATKCSYCNASITTESKQDHQAQPVQQVQPQVAPQTTVVVNQVAPDPRASWPIKNKIVAGLLALFFGGIGIHEFYLGRSGKGVMMLLFCWTGIPAMVAFFQAIIILASNDENFQIKYKCRIKP